MGPSGKARSGTSIIEVVLALMILSVGLPPLMVCFVEAAAQSVRPAQATIAAFLAQERMEEIIARRYQGTDGYDALTTANFPSEAEVAGFPGFSRAVSIRYATAGLATAASDEGYKVVRVTVAWRGGAESIEIEHAFADF
jgi:Tfp pilus assembly protein PilV